MKSNYVIWLKLVTSYFTVTWQKSVTSYFIVTGNCNLIINTIQVCQQVSYTIENLEILLLYLL